MTLKKPHVAAAALLVGVSLLAGLNAARQQGHASLLKTYSAQSKVRFPEDIIYKLGACPFYKGRGFACFTPPRTVYLAAWKGERPDRSIFLHESCHAWQYDHANDQASKQQIKAILNYPPRERFDWAPGEAEKALQFRTPPVEAFADAYAQCAGGHRAEGYGYGRGLSLQRWKGLCKFIQSRS